jgi:cyclohexanone monooxygenase
MDYLRQNYDSILAYLKTTETSFPYHRFPKKAVDATPEERQALFEKLYNSPGYGIWLASYKDVLLNRQSNEYLAGFVADKIRQRVNDPAVAEKLIPKNHPFGSRRVPMETRYYETYNRPNVRLVDIRDTPVRRITPQGLETVAESFDLDVLIFATGFDAVTGALDRIDIRGRNGVALKDAWAEGPATYLGLQSVGFPNLFTLVGPHNGAAFCNIGVCGGLQVDWVSKMLRDMRNRGFTYAEPEPAAQDKWTDDVYREFARTLMAEADAWWVKTTTNADGSVTRRALAYLSGGQEYRTICDRVAYHDYQGFVLR